MRAIWPSSRMTSQITPAGLSPAMRQRSTLPSVWPARMSTPPLLARRGKTWPGVTTSPGFTPSATAVSTVCARSKAEMPVVTPSRASMETVKLVPNLDWFDWAMSGSSRRSIISGAMARQMSPRPYLAMKLMASGVVFSAAMTRSPSFSRSSSSTMMTIRPCRMSSMASSMVHRGMDEPRFVAARRRVASMGRILKQRRPPVYLKTTLL